MSGLIFIMTLDIQLSVFILLYYFCPVEIYFYISLYTCIMLYILQEMQRMFEEVIR
jgi:hypothetical protein